MKPMNRLGSPRIFIIDDSITDCRLMSNCLMQAGYEVAFVTDGKEGLASVLKNPPQCLILDVVLPGISGYSICRQVRSVNRYSSIPIIIISTKNTPLDEKYSLQVGANCYLVKPFSEEVLLQTVKKVLPAFLPPTRAQTSRSFVPLSDLPGTSTALEEYNIIPYLLNEDDIMLNRNPFAGSAIVTDSSLRRLYSVIDGSRNIRQVAEVMQLDLQSTLKLLKTLWQQQYIMFYDAKHNPLKKIAIFENIKRGD